MEYVDLYQIHRFDKNTPVEETLRGAERCGARGQGALYLGASSMYAWQFQKMLGVQRDNGWARFVTMQNHYNLVYREEEREMIPLCLDEKIGCIPWSPLARGFLTGTRKRATARAKRYARARTISRMGSTIATPTLRWPRGYRRLPRARGAKDATVALAWMLTRPAVTAPIIGASKVYQLDDAVAALELKLTDDEIERLEQPYEPHPVLGHSY